MFVDSVQLSFSSGKGGAGCVSFRREKFVVNGGPDGGDGGKGGNVYFEVSPNTDTLSHFKGKKHLKADNGRPGQGRKMYGRGGEPLVVLVPRGTQVIDVESGEVLLDLVEEGRRELLLEGGKGGLGNYHFRSSSNQRPNYAQPGLEGETREVRLELKMIADVGLVGFPNVGKSTLISTLSNARPEVANYEFTTLIPNLGVVDVDDMRSFVMADIPGIIEGASEGRGLGLEFLKHIERTKVLLYMIDCANYRDMVNQLKTLREETENFSSELAKKPYAIALTKIDSLSEDEVKEKIDAFLSKIGVSQVSSHLLDQRFGGYIRAEDDTESSVRFVIPISSVAHINLKPLMESLHGMTREEV